VARRARGAPNAAPGAAAPALSRGRKDESASGDFSEIEEILKRRGI
jgi:hypothetical protein